MRKKDPYNPHFSCSYEQLIALSIKKESYLRRDLADLSNRGVSLAGINGMVALREALKAIPAEGADNDTVSLAVASRKETATALTTAVRTVISIAETTFDEKSAEYKSFLIKALSKLSPSELYTQSPKIVTNGNKYFGEMEPNGLTAIMLTNITSLTTDLTILVSDVFSLEGDRIIVTGERRTAADNLYDSMSGMCKTAAAYYKPTNKTKAANYTLYAKEGKPIVRQGIVKANKSSSPKTEGIKGTTKFKLKTNTGTSLQYFFALTKGAVPTASAITVAFNKKVFTNTTAAKLGYSKTLGMIVLNILNENDDEAGFVVRMGG